MADPLFLRLFDNSMEIACPADSRRIRDDSLCESPTIKSLKTQTNPFLIKNRGLARGTHQHEDIKPSFLEHAKMASEQIHRRIALPDCMAASPCLIKPARILLTSTPVKRTKTKLSSPVSPFLTGDTTSSDGHVSVHSTESPCWIVGPVLSMMQYPRLEVDSPKAGPVHDRATSNVMSKPANRQWKSSPSFGGSVSLFSSPVRKTIDAAVERADSDPDLIGDGTSAFCLPTVPGKHQDLKSITPETLAKVINHEYDHIIEKYVIIDCRYPYEYHGGHIQDSENVYTRDALMERFVRGSAPPKAEEGRRRVLIFHCEFSTERAPKLLRYLRNQDREHNVDRYPSLCYPEVYVLHEGYKGFFQSHKELCTPRSYQPMNDERFEEELWKFRNEAKHWSGDKNKRGLIKARLSALKAVYSC